ncbi:hypothetical protein H8S90_17375 [Olivibacter sp. SDN3]|nr:hypothetical protein H8S90_17375 [Olivibacter sp. SDN3]
MKNLFEKIIPNNYLHAKFLNTLSLMENTGARKISASEDTSTTTLMVLKHAAEEHRHAFYLKKQMLKLQQGLYNNTYTEQELLAPVASRQYLHKLDVSTSRYLKNNMKISGKALRFGAYLFVTYAIEVRADKLYPCYQTMLTRLSSKVNVKSIILEEQGHLEEMVTQLRSFSSRWEDHAQYILAIESSLFKEWLKSLEHEVYVS